MKIDKTAIEGVLVQHMERGRMEAIVGFRHDPLVGPVVMVGAGGTLAEVYQDYAEQAREFCSGRGEDEGLCPVIIECLLFALKNEEIHGIWGGLSSRERSGLRSRNVLPKWLENYDEESVRRIQDAITGQPPSEAVSGHLEEADGGSGEGGEASLTAAE